MTTASSDLPTMVEVLDEQRPLNEIPVSPPNGASDDDADEAGASDANSKEQLTVFHSPENFNVKHPLMNKWTLWFTKPPSPKVRCSYTLFGFFFPKKIK